MLKSNDNKIKANTVPNFSDNAVRIQAGSFVYDNKWINFNGSVFKVSEYITSVVRGSRTRFFKDRNYAVMLMVGLDPVQGVRVVEGTHVLFSTLQAVPAPSQYDFLPLVGVVVIQDGSRDLNLGYLPLKNENVLFFSGYGNIIDKNLKGVIGDDSLVYGDTGLYGNTGVQGSTGVVGTIGATGTQGITLSAPRGMTGIGGMTGISWNIHIPFRDFF